MLRLGHTEAASFPTYRDIRDASLLHLEPPCFRRLHWTSLLFHPDTAAAMDSSSAPLLAPATASLSACWLPSLTECPLVHSKVVLVLSRSLSSIFCSMFSIKSLFSTVFPAAFFHPFLRQLMNQDVRQSMAYFESVIIMMLRLRGACSTARCIAVSSAR